MIWAGQITLDAVCTNFVPYLPTGGSSLHQGNHRSMVPQTLAQASRCQKVRCLQAEISESYVFPSLLVFFPKMADVFPGLLMFFSEDGGCFPRFFDFLAKMVDVFPGYFKVFVSEDGGCFPSSFDVFFPNMVDVFRTLLMFFFRSWRMFSHVF